MYFAGNSVTRVNSFCVLGSVVTSDDHASVTLQHRTTSAWSQLWNLKDQLRSRDSTMKSRLVPLHLAVMPVLLWAAETWTLSTQRYRAIRFVYGTMVQRMEGEETTTRVAEDFFTDDQESNDAGNTTLMTTGPRLAEGIYENP